MSSLSLPVAARAGRAPETEIAHDLVRRALPVAPVLIVLSGVAWGAAGAASSAYAVALVVVNFLVAAALMAWAAKISVGVLMGTVLGGYLLRLGAITLAIMAVRDAAWVEMVPLGLTLVATHLGLLIWEARYVSLSLAFPGLKPRPEKG
ncbi:MAG TPA: ATP synthase subunit I [Acidimicrobiales bacterium]|nr:ATP synthase subunit I [Acidimicrobiales bacterium]